MYPLYKEYCKSPQVALNYIPTVQGVLSLRSLIGTHELHLQVGIWTHPCPYQDATPEADCLSESHHASWYVCVHMRNSTVPVTTLKRLYTC